MRQTTCNNNYLTLIAIISHVKMAKQSRPTRRFFSSWKLFLLLLLTSDSNPLCFSAQSGSQVLPDPGDFLSVVRDARLSQSTDPNWIGRDHLCCTQLSVQWRYLDSGLANFRARKFQDDQIDSFLITWYYTEHSIIIIPDVHFCQ